MTAAFLLLVVYKARAFSLLGPPAPWMLSSNNVVDSGDIGGPMDIGSGYRWNVPVVTYGFDQSFLDYFGSNGVAAVEGAIKIINDLPPASQLNLADYPMEILHGNYSAANLVDLKSRTLALLLEQLGLANSTRYTFVLKQWTDAFDPNNYYIAGTYSPQYIWPDWVYPDYMARLNFDPVTFVPSSYVDGTLYAAFIDIFKNTNVMEVYSVDPESDSFAAVTARSLFTGGFYGGLSYDDVGGLAYLFSTNTINYEQVLPDVSGVGANANSWVNGAWRPGIDKISLVLHSTNPGSGKFMRMTNCYTDTYLTNGIMVQQQLQRVIVQPDFLFTVTDLFDGSINSSGEQYARTGTTNWINNSLLNGNPSGEGPGIIAPPIKISFGISDRLTDTYGWQNNDELVQDDRTIAFGSFDGTTNVPVVYPVARAGTNQMITRLWLTSGKVPAQIQQCCTWSPTTNYGGVFQFQTSTNFLSWVPLFLVTNDGTITTYYVTQPTSAQRFYRMIPQ